MAETPDCTGKCVDQLEMCSGECCTNNPAVKCANYRLCGNIRPKSLMDKREGRCVECAMSFGKTLTFLNGAGACRVCGIIRNHIQLPDCNHSMCIPCFRAIYARWCIGNRTTADGMDRIDEKEWNRCPFCRVVTLPTVKKTE